MNTRAQTNQRQDFAPAQGGAVALLAPRIAMPAEAKTEFDVDVSQWRVLTEATFPSAKTAISILMALEYCRKRNLDIFKKPVHIVPMWNSALRKEVETVWPGIAELRTTAFRTAEYAGCEAVEWGPVVEREFEDEKETWDRGQKTGAVKVNVKVRFHEWGRMTVHRVVKGAVRAFVGPQVYWEEIYATSGKTIIPNDRWQRAPNGQHEKTIEAAALRKAFPEELGGEYAAEEMEGKTILDSVPYAVRAEAPPPPEPPAPPEFDAPEQGAPAPVAASKAAAGSVPSRSQPQQEIDRPALDVEKWLRGLEAACAKATSEAELRVVWDSQKAAYSSLGDADKKRANGIVGKRKRSFSEPAEVVEPAFSLDAFLVELDETFGQATAVDALSELFAAEVDPRLEQGLVSRADVEGKIADLFQKHRDRIEGDDFPGDL